MAATAREIQLVEDNALYVAPWQKEIQEWTF